MAQFWLYLDNAVINYNDLRVTIIVKDSKGQVLPSQVVGGKTLWKRPLGYLSIMNRVIHSLYQEVSSL